MKNSEQNEETLDPQDWDKLRALGHKMLDEMFDHFLSLRNKPVWQPMPENVKKNFAQPIPFQGEGEEKVLEEFLDKVLPYPNGNIHPRFWGWVQGNGFPLAMIADMLASGLNPHMAGFNQAPAMVEKQVISWLIELMDMPKSASGILTSGGSMANFIGLIVARHSKAGFDLRQNGLYNQPRLVFYGSSETHYWAQLAIEILGLGKIAYRAIPVNSAFQLDIEKLKEKIKLDRELGEHPICVIATAGTVNTGAIDDLLALSKICSDENLWFHIDGAFGALINLVPNLKHLLKGMQQADSLAFDLHKWGYLPFEIGCLLVKDEKIHLDTFSRTASYVSETNRGMLAGGLHFAQRGIELTRGFKALKVWIALKAYGVDKLSRIIEQNVSQAEYLASLIGKHKCLEILAPVSLNIVCFRFKQENLSEHKLNRFNEELLLQIQESGVAVLSGTTINGSFALRVAITNHRSRFEDFDLLVQKTIELGQAINIF